MLPRYDLAALIIAVTLWCGFWTLARLFGVGNVILFGWIPALVVVFWALLYKLAPDATFHFTLFGFIGVCCFALLVSSLLLAREEARRANCGNELRMVVFSEHYERTMSGFKKYQNRSFAGSTVLD